MRVYSQQCYHFQNIHVVGYISEIILSRDAIHFNKITNLPVNLSKEILTYTGRGELQSKNTNELLCLLHLARHMPLPTIGTQLSKTAHLFIMLLSVFSLTDKWMIDQGFPECLAVKSAMAFGFNYQNTIKKDSCHSFQWYHIHLPEQHANACCEIQSKYSH